MWLRNCCIIPVVSVLLAAAERPPSQSRDSLDFERRIGDVRSTGSQESTAASTLHRHEAGLQLSFDWLFQKRSGRCEYQASDSFIRLVDCGILALCFSLAATAVLGTRCTSIKLSIDQKQGFADPARNLWRKMRQEEADADDENDEAVPEEAPRLLYFDFARFLCVACIVAEHSGGSGLSANIIFFVEQWAMPLLYFISGACFALSKKPLSDYLFRCLVIFVLGVGANSVADARTARDWRTDFGNTISQMGYVALLAALAILLAPLRHAFQQCNNSGCNCLTGRKPGLIHRGKFDWVSDRRDSLADGDRSAQICTCRLLHPCSLPAFLVLSWGLAMFAGLRYEAAGKPLIELQDSNLLNGWQVQGVLGNSPLIVASVAGQVFLCSLSCLVGTSGWLGWILVATIFLPRVLVPWPDFGKSHNVELYILGFAVHMQPLRGRRVVARLVQAYWPIFLCLVMLLGMPSLRGQCDLNLLVTYAERFRSYFLEAMILASFACGGFCVSDPCRVAGLLNWWALFAYCSHVALYRLFGSPHGAVITYGCLLPISAALHFLGGSGKVN